MAEEKAETKCDSVRFAVAFDIGTYTTGYALSHNRDPELICTNYFAGSRAVERAPTSVLVDNEKQFIAFGVEAEDMYAELDKEQKDKGWALFRRFKDQINSLTNLNKNDTELVDISQKIKMSAINLFSMVIKYLKDKALTDIRSKPINLKMEHLGEIQEDQIDYAITVPAFWPDSIRCMVRFAAFEADIAADRLQVFPEFDAARVWCRHDPDIKIPELRKAGTKHIVVNMGGSKMEITAHEVTKRETLKQLTKCVVTEFAGQFVDNRILIFFGEIFGKETMDEFKTDHPDEYTEFVDSFALIKRRITLDYSQNLYIKLPATLRDINASKTKDSGRDFRSMVESQPYLKLVADKLRLDPKFVRLTFFSDCVENIIYTIEDNSYIHETDYILCTGGFSTCKYVLDVLADNFPKKKIVCPKDVQNSIVKGAVIYRHRPGMFGRKAKFTYGRSEHVLFDKNLHSGQPSRVIGHDVWCTEVFHKYVTKGQDMSYDFEITEYGLLPMEGKRLSATCSLYQTSQESPRFVSDNGCTPVGQSIIHKFPHEQELSDRKYDLTIRFLFDEIRITLSHKKSNTTVTQTRPFY